MELLAKDARFWFDLCSNPTDIIWKVDYQGHARGQVANIVQELPNGTFRSVIFLNGYTLMAARVMWLLHNGDIPKGKRLVFKDKDNLNIAIDNISLGVNIVKEKLEKKQEKRKNKDKLLDKITKILIRFDKSSLEGIPLSHFTSDITSPAGLALYNSKVDYLISVLENYLVAKLGQYGSTKSNPSLYIGRVTKVAGEFCNNVQLSDLCWHVVNGCSYGGFRSDHKLVLFKGEIQARLFHILQEEEKLAKIRKVAVGIATSLKKGNG